MNDEEKSPLTGRTKSFALRIIRLYSALPKTAAAQVIGKQLLRSGTSVGAQYREARRSRSRAEFISKTESAIQELDETTYWLELLSDAKIIPAKRLDDLVREATELTAMLVSSAKTAKENRPAGRKVR
ncbi:MAG TPA: four helix bundle protein [Pirellulales bacterium]|nr:four helix bundle protein [Pirellulales bacterium]